MRKLFLLINICGLLYIAVAAAEGSTKVFYRYKNGEGITVMQNAIPPQYVSQGYEVLSRTGKVLKVVPPAPKQEDLQRVRNEQRLKEEREQADIKLRRSYSNVADIESAKLRNLENLRGNIDILLANLTNIRSKLHSATAQAATLERSGRSVSAELLKIINHLEQEEKDIQTQISQRETEYQSVSDKFDSDRQRFIELVNNTEPKN